MKEFTIQNLINTDTGNKNNMEMFELLQKELSSLRIENESKKEKDRKLEKEIEKQSLEEILKDDGKIYKELLNQVFDCKNK